MRKLRKKVKKQEEMKLDNKKKYLKIGLGAGVLCVLFVILMIVELNKGIITINNDSEHKLEYVKAYYVYSEGHFNNGIKVEKLDGQDKYKGDWERAELFGMEANLELRFKFENHEEMLIDAGYFNDTFEGNIKVDFVQEDDLVRVAIKATNGVLPSRLIDCDEVFYANLEEGYVEEGLY